MATVQVKVDCRDDLWKDHDRIKNAENRAFRKFKNEPTEANFIKWQDKFQLYIDHPRAKRDWAQGVREQYLKLNDGYIRLYPVQ